MTLKEAKKILEKEGFKLEGPGKPGVVCEFFTEYESPEICEAMQIVCSAGYGIMMLDGVFEVRKKRLKKEYEENTKAPGSGEGQSKEKKGIIYPSTFPKADFYYKHVLNEGNPALKESATQFNDALLDEQAKKIKRLGKEIARLNKIIHKKNLTDKVVDKIDAQALKSAESALAYKEKVIAEKDEVIADLGKELKATKTELDEKTKLVETVRKRSKEYREYGIEAVKMIRKMAKDIVNDRPVPPKDYEQYRLWANGGIFMPEISEKELMKLQEKVCADILADDTFEKWLLFGKIIIKSEK